MTRQLTFLCLHIAILSMLLQTCHIHCFQRLLRRKLTSDEISSKNSDDIRSLVSASLTANEPASGNNNKRDTSSDDQASIDSANEDNIAAESKDSSVYEDDTDEQADGGQQNRQIDDVEYKKRSADSDSSSALDEHAEISVDQADFSVDDEADPKEEKDVVKREARNEDDYDEDDFEGNAEGDPSIASDRKNTDVAARSTVDDNAEDNVRKNDNPRDTSAIVADSDLDYEKQVEEQIQQRIDSIKDDIKREIERKQRVREIEANNAKYDELEFRREDDEVADETPSESSKRLISRDTGENNDKSEGNIAIRSKRRSDLENVDDVKREDDKDVSVPLPVKKRSFARRMTLVEKRDTRNPRMRKDRSSILIPERSHAEVKDDLPADLTLDPNLRIARSYDKTSRSSGASRSSRSKLRQEDSPAGRYRRDMSGNFENYKSLNEIDEAPDESSNFLFAAREKPESRNRRRRSRGRDHTRSTARGKSHKHPRHSRRHRAIRGSSMDDEELEDGERDKRAMSIDEDAALEYKESFGGFPSESGGALGRFKRIRRSVEIS